MLLVAAAGMLLASGQGSQRMRTIYLFRKGFCARVATLVWQYEVGYAVGDIFENGWCKMGGQLWRTYE